MTEINKRYVITFLEMLLTPLEHAYMKRLETTGDRALNENNLRIIKGIREYMELNLK